MAILSKLCTAALLAVLPCTTALSLSREYSGDNFTSGFAFRTAADYPGSGDPTGGFVNYLSESDAIAKGLVKVVNEQVYLGADSTTTLSTSVQGRDSIRMEATESFTNGLLIADIAHMPGNACGVWPAFWTFNFDEDPYGEIDIIEGAMHQLDNIVSLHTCGTCQFAFSGTDPRSNCNLGGEAQGCADAGVTNADGCGNTAPSGSYGDRFNSIGGGVYATYVQPSSLKIWFFPRSSIPADIASGNPNPSNWPAPFLDAEQSSKGCNVGNFFKKQTLIINTDFCGAMIDQDTWDADSSCSSKASTCVDFVAKNPGAFTEAYWLFNSIQLYQ